MGTSAGPVTIQEFSTPYPPRYRWLKRSFLIVGIVLVLLAGLRIWWGWYAQRCLRAEIDAIHARGEPILPEDFQVPEVPNTDNAAWYMRQAAGAIKHLQDIEQADTHALWMNAPLADVASDIAADGAALHYGRLARQHKQLDWSNPQSQPDLQNQRNLAYFLYVAAAVQHRQGQDTQTIQTLRDLKCVADATQQCSPTLISHLVGVGNDVLASSGAIHLSYVLQLPDSNSDQSRQIGQLLGDLSDERQYQAGGVQSWYGERSMTVRYFLNSPRPGLEWRLIYPAFELGQLHVIEDEGRFAQATTQPTWTVAHAVMPPQVSTRERGSPYFISHMDSSIMRPTWDGVLLRHFRGLTRRRAAVVALATQLYRADHGGHWPAALDDLVPKYVAAVPIDPFSPTASPMRYKRGAPGGPIVYSVGEDGVDNGGSEQPIDPNHPSSSSEWETLDAVFHLTYQPLPSRPGNSP